MWCCFIKELEDSKWISTHCTPPPFCWPFQGGFSLQFFFFSLCLFIICSSPLLSVPSFYYLFLNSSFNAEFLLFVPHLFFQCRVFIIHSSPLGTERRGEEQIIKRHNTLPFLDNFIYNVWYCTLFTENAVIKTKQHIIAPEFWMKSLYCFLMFCY